MKASPAGSPSRNMPSSRGTNWIRTAPTEFWSIDLSRGHLTAACLFSTVGAGDWRSRQSPAEFSGGQFLQRLSAVHQKKHRHAHGQAIGYLFQNDGTAAIGDFTVDFH